MCLLTANLPETVKIMLPIGIQNPGLPHEASWLKVRKILGSLNFFFL